MIKIMMTAGLLVFAPLQLQCQAPEWHSTVVVRARYGSGEGEFCYEDVVNNHPESDQAVSCYYVGSEGIFIVDRYQGNIKIFDLSGKYMRTISLKLLTRPVPQQWGLPNNEQVVAIDGADIAVTGGVIYLLRMMAGHPYGDLTKYSLYALDLETGKLLEPIMIHNPVLGTNLEGREVGNSVRINVESEGTLTVYDRIRRLSYPLISNGSVVPAQEQKAGVPGRRFGMGHARYNPEMGTVAILDEAGTQAICECKGAEVAVDVNGRFLLIDEKKLKEHIIYRLVYDSNCHEIGRLAIPIGSRKGWSAFGPNDRFRFGPDGGLYEIHIADDALYVYRWSP